MKQSFRTPILATKAIAIILVFTLTLSSCSKDGEIIDPIEMGSDAPEFTLNSLEGDDVSLSNFNNKVVVLFFFGNNCPSCKAAAPSVESMLVTPFASSTDYMVLGLDQWNGNAASVEAFKSATNVTFPLLLNASEVASDYKTTYDRIVVIDKSGKIAFSGKQSAASDIAAAKAKVMELINPVTPTNLAPGFTLKSLDGSDVSLSNFTNKVVVLFFFGNNCPSCKAAAPNVQSMLVTPFASSTDYMVLGLDQWNGNAASVEAFKSITGVSFPLLLNASGVASDYNTTFDRIVVIDKSGKIAFSGKQSAASDIAAAKAKVMELINPVTSTNLAPGFTLKSLDGSDVSLSSFLNKVVVLFFFGNNCPSCKAAAPNVESMLVTPFASKSDYMVLGLDQWNGNAASVEAFKAATNVTFPLLLNASGVAADYKTSYDRIVVIDKAGNIAFKGTQTASSDITAAKTKVMELLAK